MANPTPTEQQMITLLNSVVVQLQKLNTSATAAKSNATKTANAIKRKSTIRNDLKSFADNADRMNKSLNKAEAEFQKTSEATKSFGKQLSDVVKDAILPGRKILKDTIKEWNDALTRSVKDQASEYKDIARGTQDYLRTNKNAMDAIRNSVGAYKNFNTVLRNMSITNGQLTKVERQQMLAFMDTLGALNKQTKGNVDIIGNNNALTKDQATALKNLTKTGKLTQKQLTDLIPRLEQVGKNFEVVTKVTTDYADAQSAAATKAQRTISDGFKSLFANLNKAFGTFVPAMFEDLKAQARNAVADSRYMAIQSGMMGISQGQLADFIGKNRINLRALGGGSALGAIDNGQLGRLKTQTTNITGLTGEDAFKYLGQTMDSISKMGTPVQNTTEAMKSMYKVMQQTNMDVGEFGDMMAEFSNSPAFINLIRSKGYGDAAEEIAILNKISLSTGYSKDYLKSMLEMNQQARYGGIADMIKAQIGTRLETAQLNARGANISTGDRNLLLMQEQGADLAAMYKNGKLDNFDYNGKKLTDVFKTGNAFQAQVDKIPTIYSNAYTNQTDAAAANGGGVGLGIRNTLHETNVGLMGKFGAIFDPNATIQARALNRARYGHEGPANTSEVGKLIGSQDRLVEGVDKLNNSLSMLPDRFNDLLFKLEDIFKGIGKNPIGMAAGSIFNAGKDVIDLVAGWKIIGALGKGGGGLGALTGGTGVSGIAGAAGKLGRFGKFIPGVGGVLAGASTYAETGKFGKSVGTGAGAWGGAELGAGVGTAFFPGVGTIIGGIIGGLAGAYGGGKLGGLFDSSDKKDDDTAKNNPIGTAPVNPSGDSAGDLFTKMVDSLNAITLNTQKQIDMLQQTHDEYMDFLTQNGLKDAINAARLANHKSLV